MDSSRRYASSFSTQPAAESLTKRRNSSSIATHVVVITWENILFPVNWMALHLGLSDSLASVELAWRHQRQSPALTTAVAAIEEQAMILLNQAVACANGPVCIVSECTTAYVELVSSAFFPRLTDALRQVTSGLYVLGKPDTQLSALELGRWKANLLRTVLCERVFGDYDLKDALRRLKRPVSGRVGVLALCATGADALATNSLSSTAPYAVLKCVRMQSEALTASGSTPGLDGFHTQLQALVHILNDAVASTKPLHFAV